MSKNDAIYSAQEVLDARDEVARVLNPQAPSIFTDQAEQIMRAGYVDLEAVLKAVADRPPLEKLIDAL